MIDPETLANRLETNLHPEDIEYDTQAGPGVKYYTYILEFTDYKTFSLLRKQIETLEDAEDISLVIDGVEPTLHQNASKIEARQAVYVTETENRHAVENRQLHDYSE